MSTVKISSRIHWAGILNPAMRVFDICLATDYGTSYNAYIVKGDEKTALIEASHLSFFPHFLQNLREKVDLEEIDYVILNHNEPDHSGCLADLLEYLPNATILASQAGNIYLKNITNRTDLPMRAVKNGEVLDLGGVTLEFIMAPFLHWPDSMFTWCREEKALFSCDFTGCHYCEPYVFDYNVTYPEKFAKALKEYYDGIFGPFPTFVQAGLDKIKDLDIEFICNSHGPVLTKHSISTVLEKYRLWCQPKEKKALQIPVFYASAYGNTRRLAKSIAQGIREVLPQAEVSVHDLVHADIAQMQDLLNASDAFALGSPTINADAVPPCWALLSHVDAINNKQKPALVFGSFGWSGEGVPNLITRCQGLKMKVFGEGMRVTFVPSAEDLTKAKDLGAEFARSLPQ